MSDCEVRSAAPTMQSPTEKAALMRKVVGEDIDERVLLKYIAGAGGEVETAINHYFASTEAERQPPKTGTPMFSPRPDPFSDLTDPSATGHHSEVSAKVDALRQAADRKMSIAREKVKERFRKGSAGGGWVYFFLLSFA